MIDIPSYIPINTKRLKEYILNKYNINIYINGEFVEEVLDDKYDYHVYKKGKKKDTIEFKKSNKNKSKIKSLKNIIFKDDNNLNTDFKKNNINIPSKDFDIASDTSKNDVKFSSNFEKVFPSDIGSISIEENKKDIRYIITKSIKCRCNEKNKEILYLKNNHEQLKYFYYFLLDKHKNTFNFFKSLTLGLKKIHKNMENINVDNIEYKKLISFIEKIIPNNILINNLM